MALATVSQVQDQSHAGQLRRIKYRVIQVVASLRPTTTADEHALLAQWLPPQGVALFAQMASRDQRHSLDVFKTLRAAGHDQPDLLAAALLHDVAKTVHEGRRLRLHHRVAIVLLNAGRPDLVEQVARQDPADWRHPFYVHLHHPEQGAALARQAGCSELTATLIRRHQDKLASPPVSETDRLLVLLQAADDAH